METIRIKTATGLLIGCMVEDDVQAIMEDQGKMIEQVNISLGLGGKTEIF